MALEKGYTETGRKDDDGCYGPSPKGKLTVYYTLVAGRSERSGGRTNGASVCEDFVVESLAKGQFSKDNIHGLPVGWHRVGRSCRKLMQCKSQSAVFRG
ncbi:MAG: hypothetical protein IJJ94_10100 [Bacteroidaceae bacterium]|nr:hypothetical protein [Bacteroidaceae bacterium]